MENKEKKPIADIKDDIKIIKIKIDNIDKNIQEIISCLKGTQDIFKEWEKDIARIDKAKETEIQKSKYSSWFY